MKIRFIGTYFFCFLFLLFSNVTVVDTVCSLIHSTHNHEFGYHFNYHPGHDRPHQHDNMPDHEPHGLNQADQILQTGKKVSDIEIKQITLNLVLFVSYIWKTDIGVKHFVLDKKIFPTDYFFQSSLSSRGPPLAQII